MASTAARARLAEAGIRPTPQRALVLDALAAEPDGATAQDLHRRLRERGERIGLATVYRSLAALHSSGVVDALAHRPGEACYRVCHADRHHHHLVCRACERVVELGDCDVAGWVERAARRHGFADLDHRLEVSGLCAECR